MLFRSGQEEQVMFCGGVARNTGTVKVFEKLLKTSLILPENVDRVGALGAALAAKKA